MSALHEPAGEAVQLDEAADGVDVQRRVAMWAW
jgi:hypothetical protein